MMNIKLSRLLLVLILPVVFIFPTQNVTAACDPISTITVENRYGNGTVAASLSGNTVCEAVISIENKLPFWTFVTIKPMGEEGTWFAASGGKANPVARSHLIPPKTTVRYAAKFDTKHNFLYFNLTSENEPAKMMNFFQTVLDIGGLIPGLGGPGEVFNFISTEYTEIVNAFGSVPHLKNVVLVKGNLLSELKLALSGKEFDRLIDYVKSFATRHGIKMAAKDLDSLLKKKFLDNGLSAFTSLSDSLSKLYVRYKGYTNGWVSFSYKPKK